MISLSERSALFILERHICASPCLRSERIMIDFVQSFRSGLHYMIQLFVLERVK